MNPDDALRFHHDTFVIDAHDDLMVDVMRRRLRGESGVLGRVYAPKLRAGGVNLVFLTCGGDMSTMFDGADQPGWSNAALRIVDELHREIDEAGDEFAVVRTKGDLDRLGDNRIGILIHFEGGRPLEGQLGLLRQFHRLGLRSIGLAFFLRNALADSCAERSPAGLSHFGAAVVREAQRLGMVVDIAHLSEAGAFDVLELARGPIVASHANAHAVKAHPRNLSDELVRGIARSGGVIGLTAFPQFVSDRRPQPTLDDLLVHVDHIVGLVGVDHVGFGPDFIDFAPEVFLQYRAKVAASVGLDVAPRETIYPSEIADITMFPNVTRALFARDYSKDDIAKILGGNFRRVLTQVLPGTAGLADSTAAMVQKGPQKQEVHS